MAEFDPNFDFGFTTMNEAELDAVQKANDEVDQTTRSNEELKSENNKLRDQVDDLTIRLENIYRAIQPLLNNLKSDPQKSYLYWPNRTEKIDSFNEHLRKIKEG